MKRVAILGAGIMGSATALFLSRRGVPVTLFDAADQPLAAASRWNEGKIHLGYLYAADPSLDTARRLLPGGLAFKPLTEELLGRSIDPAVAHDDDVYAMHRDSIVPVDAAAHYFAAVADLVTGHADADRYLVPAGGRRPHRLTRPELAAQFDTALVVAGFRVAERSVSTRWIADRFVEALAAERAIEQRMRTRVVRVRRHADTLDPPLVVETTEPTAEPFDIVVNASWEGRLVIDAGLGLPMPPVWSHRFRRSAFLRTSRPVDVPSAVIATGPFGDVKNYNRREFYLSWYDSGLVAEGSCVEPPELPALDEPAPARVIGDILDRLAAIVHPVTALRSCIEDVRLEGGWVYAAGRGSLADRSSTLHRRHRIGIRRTGSYISVDTGKYSTAPWLAREVAESILD